MRTCLCFSILVFLTGLPLNLFSQHSFNIKQSCFEPNHTVIYASYSNDGTYIVTTDADSSVIVWNAGRRTVYRTLSGMKARQNVAVISNDSKYVFSGGKDNKVTMWDLSANPPKVVKTFEGHRDAVKSLDVSPDGNFLATGSADGTVRIWNTGSASEIYNLKEHNGDVNAVVFSSDSRYLVSGGADGMLIVWGIANGNKIQSVKAHNGWIRDIAFTTDGNSLGSCGDDKLINIWQFPGLKKTGTLSGHKDWIQAIDFSPDGKNLLSGGRDKLIILWDIASQKILLQSEKQKNIVMAVDICPIRPDFISSYYQSEDIDTWALFGLDETQWTNSVAEISKPLVSGKAITEDQQRIVKDVAVSQISPVKEKPRENAMIEIFSPVPKEGRISTDKPVINMIGRVTDPDGINTFLINKTPVKVTDEGIFQTTINLVRGENPVSIIAINNKMKMDELDITISCTSEAVTADGSREPDIFKGKYYALLMAVNDYQSSEITDLDNPIKDAENLYNILITRYTFEKDNITFLRNPTYSEMITALDNFGKKLSQNDNLLIFYAGHGYYDEKGKIGFWFPSDAAKGSSVNWFRNSTLREYLGSIQTRHTILIADACFSGAIFKTRAPFIDAPQGIQKLYELPSRKAITSGIMQEVPDESVFMRCMIDRLAANNEKFLSSEILFSSFKTEVMNNSPNIPQYGVIQNAGDAGGDFVFIRR